MGRRIDIGWLELGWHLECGVADISEDPVEEGQQDNGNDDSIV